MTGGVATTPVTVPSCAWAGHEFTATMQGLTHVATFVATRWELQAIRQALTALDLPVSEHHTTHGLRCVVSRRGACRLSLIQTGIGPKRAERASRELMDAASCDLIISTGFACALTPSGIGDLLIGTEAVSLMLDSRSPSSGRIAGSGAVPCTSSFQEFALRTAQALGRPARLGRIVTVERVLVESRQKQAAAEATGAIGLDMESAALGTVAAEHRIPFLIARSVSDLVTEELPVDFNLFLTHGGRLRGLLRLMRPSVVWGLHRLRAQATVASGSLAAFFTRFLSTL